jgi:hypothetical protein
MIVEEAVTSVVHEPRHVVRHQPEEKSIVVSHCPTCLLQYAKRFLLLFQFNSAYLRLALRSH